MSRRRWMLAGWLTQLVVGSVLLAPVLAGRSLPRWIQLGFLALFLADVWIRLAAELHRDREQRRSAAAAVVRWLR